MECVKFTLESFVDYMLKEHHVTVVINQVGYEAVELAHDEIDLDIIPEYIVKELPNPALYYLFTYKDDKEWMVAVAVEANTDRPLFLVCTLNGEVIDT